MLTFEKELHEYRWDGVKVPGVTSVLKEFIKFEHFGDTYYLHVATGNVIPVATMEHKAKIGTAIHKGMFYLFTGQGLSWDSLDPAIEPALRQGQKFIDDFEAKVEMCEQPLHSRHGYAGTLDFYGNIKGCKGKALIDIKTGMYGNTAGYQTAAYEELVRENNKIRGQIDRYVLDLPADGSEYKLVPMTNKTDFQVFLMKLQLYKLEG